jgi:hypothetical protein
MRELRKQQYGKSIFAHWLKIIFRQQRVFRGYMLGRLMLDFKKMLGRLLQQLFRL